MAQTLTSKQDLKATIDQFDTLLFDCDGVIWEGDEVLPGVHKTMQYFRKLGKKIIFVTNNATKSRAENKKKFDKMGIECTVDEIFSSAYASAAYLKNILKFPSDKKVYVIGEKGIEDELDSVGIRRSGGTNPDDNRFVDLMDFSAITPDPEVGAILCGLDMHLNYLKIARAFRYLRENEGCLLVATNLDSTFPTHGSVYPGGGATTAPILFCSDKKPIVIGKPEKAMMDCILETNHLDKSRTLMIGDRLDTDILFGNSSGLKTLMVLTGVNKRADFEKDGAVAVPTYVVDKLGDFGSLADE
ncbi:2-phosphoglycolate phosphatase [Meredithblackwellia eburnea MCA 4105]